MADYQSSHSGQEIDTAVTNVLNGSCGIQGIQLNGTDITPDSSNKVNISTSDFFTSGTFTPELVCVGTTPTQPQCTGTKTGYYYLIDKLCYISFFMSLTMTNKGSGTYQIAHLPFTASNVVQEYGLSFNGFNFSNSFAYVPTITMHVMGGSSNIQIEDRDGRTSVTTDNVPSGTLSVEASGAGFYIVS